MLFVVAGGQTSGRIAAKKGMPCKNKMQNNFKAFRNNEGMHSSKRKEGNA